MKALGLRGMGLRGPLGLALEEAEQERHELSISFLLPTVFQFDPLAA